MNTSFDDKMNELKGLMAQNILLLFLTGFSLILHGIMIVIEVQTIGYTSDFSEWKKKCSQFLTDFENTLGEK